jgi:uncharacterized protein with ParB-like and HNH nuclease domain
MANLSFSTENRTFRDLFGNSRVFNVPPFQRDYSWDINQWDDLWADISSLEEADGSHYMGFIVLQSANSKEFTVIDGQQRIATICLLIIAGIKYLKTLSANGVKTQDNKTRAKQFETSYIGFISPVSLTQQSKLNLNRNNNDFFQNYILTLRDFPKRGLSIPEKLIKKSFEWFYKKVSDEFKEDDGRNLAAFIEKIADSLFFSVITVNNELNAYKVFETLNARGIALSSTDLLKNYLFSLISDDPHKVRELEKRWHQIVQKISDTNFPKFMRTYWNSFNPFVRQTDLYKKIRSKINSHEDVTNLIIELEDVTDIYVALKKPEDEFWNDYENVSKYLTELRLFKVSQPYGMLIAAYKKLGKQHFIKLLKSVSTLSFRYNVIGKLNPNELEVVYNNIAVKLSRGNLEYREIIRSLKKVYVPDEEFNANFSNISIDLNSSSKKLVRYILTSIENHCSGKLYDFESEKLSIEHIYPQNPDDNWPEIDESYIARLGNYTLLSRGENKDLGNSPYRVKTEIFEKSNFAITKRIAAEYSEWNSEKIAINQKWLARQALTIWKITELQ